MTRSRIYIVGFMGAGKTTIGWLLAKKLGWKFVDLDHEVEKAEKRHIAAIFRDSGEPYFRDLERKYLQYHSTMDQAVIALGGGTFADSANRTLANSSGLTVWLKVSFATVVDRVKMDGTRPLFESRIEAERLLMSREEFYKSALLHTVVDGRRPAEIVDDIVGALGNL